MANWYTSTRNGNDTTGDGSTLAPFATIYKAATVALAGDTINTEGDELVNSGVTITSTSGASTTLTTSSSLVGVLSAGSIFTINDPVWGLGKIWFKVRSISSTSITVNQTCSILGTFDLHYIAAPSYSVNTSSAYPEDLSGLVLDGINFEGGWDPTFTIQDRITWATYVTTSSIGGSVFLRLGTSQSTCAQSNLSFNRFGVGGNSMFTAGQCSGGFYDNLYSAYGQINVNGETSTMGTISTSSTTIAQAPYNSTYPINVANLYLGAGNSYIFGDGNSTYKITNLYTKATATTVFTKPTAGQLDALSMDIGHLYIDWMQATTQDGSYTLLDEVNCRAMVRGLTHQGNYVGTGKKITVLALSGAASATVVTSQNVDDWGLQAYATNSSTSDSFGYIKDIEGNKQYWNGGLVIFADPTQFDTGTNSLRVNKAITTDQYQTVPIKSFFNDTVAAKTATIRAKATTDTLVQFGFLGNPAYSGGGIPMVNNGLHTITSTWADYTVQLSADNAARMLDSFINVAILPSGDWASNYVWIDSVTIA